MGYFVYFEQVESEQFINNPYNKRQELFTRSVVRGSIYSADGVTLAETVTDAEGNETKVSGGQDLCACCRIFHTRYFRH